jgi:hypothetical protein
LTAVAIIVGVPLGVGTAIFLREYTKESKFGRVIRFGTGLPGWSPFDYLWVIRVCLFCH